MTDMVPLSVGGNHSSHVPEGLRLLEGHSRGKYRLLTKTNNEISPKEKLISQGVISICRELVSYEVNGAMPLLGKEYNSIKQITNNAEITHDSILQSFKES